MNNERIRIISYVITGGDNLAYAGIADAVLSTNLMLSTWMPYSVGMKERKRNYLT
jgi:hypothetical protein